jgi:riboflavin kinase / FMN adenylyltransferase
MKVFRSFEEARVIKNAVVTTGSFDGVHIGHKTILNRLKKLAERENGESVLITFDPHPRKILYPDTAGKGLKLINSQEEKLELLQKTGLDNVIIVEFTLEFSKITSEQFVKDFLHGILKAKVIVAGFNHHFGFNKEGDYRQLWGWRERYHFDAEEIPEQEVQHETVSSTRIRQAISEGYIQRANAYLDHFYIIMGKAEQFIFEGVTNVLPLAEVPITEECKLLPPPGIYAVSAGSDKSSSKGMVIVHPKPVGNNFVLVHVFENQHFTFGNNITLFFHKKIHGAIDLAESKTIGKLDAAKKEISELIY